MTKDPDRKSAAETARLRDEGLKRMLKTPPRAHENKKAEQESSQRKGPGGKG